MRVSPNFGKTRIHENSAHDMCYFNTSEFGVKAAEGGDELFVVDAEDGEHMAWKSRSPG